METKATLNGVIVAGPSSEAKYLGVIFDQVLRFKSRVVKRHQRGNGIASIAKSTWGTLYTHVRQLFQAVVAPRIGYATIVWH